MKTAEEYLVESNIGNSNLEITDLMKHFAREAIKADRENVAKRGKVKLEAWTGG